MKKSKSPDKSYPPAPGHLSERSRALWDEIGPREVRSEEQRVLFQAALESLDRAEEARKVVSEEGLTFKTEGTGTVHVHPLLKIEREARAQFARIWDLLNLRFRGIEDL